MSTFITKSSSLSGPYIGSRRIEHYIPSRLSSSPLLSSNDYYNKSFLPNQSARRIFLLNGRTTTDVLQERIPIEYASSPILSNERQLHQEQKAKGFLSSSSSSLFSNPTTQNIRPITCYDRSPSFSFVKEQQNFRHHHLDEPQYSYSQPSNRESKNNQSLLSEQLDYQKKQKQSSIQNHRIEFPRPLEENKWFSSSSLLSDRVVVNKGNRNQSNLLTSTPIVSPYSSNHRITNNNTSGLLSSTQSFPTNYQHKSNIYQLNSMSSLQDSSNLNTNSSTKISSYDQRISDQGNKYIIQLKTDDYHENEFTITPQYDYQNKLIIDAKHNEEDSFGGYIRRELHKIFLIPKHIDLSKYIYRYNKNTQELIIEMPYLRLINNENNSSFISSNQNSTQSYGNLNLTNEKNISPIIQSSQLNHNTDNITINKNSKPFDYDLFHRSVFRPQILGKSLNEKKLVMSLDLVDYQPEDIKISIKDHELIVKAERKIETNTRKSRTSFFQSTSLPPQTNIQQLKTNYIDGKLIIEAPYIEKQNNQDRNERAVIELEQKIIIEDPYQQRTETVKEYVRRRQF